MRVRTRSACAALAWGIIVLITTAAGPIGSPRPAPATTRIASSTSSTNNTNSNSSITIQATLTGSATTTATGTSAGRRDTDGATVATRRAATRPRVPASAGRPASSTSGYVVQPGETLSGIAVALATHGGWPALYAANRKLIGPDPGLIRPGMVLALPQQAAADRYTVAVGDTLSGIAAALRTPGGWPALYAANRPELGPEPNAIRPGVVLVIPHPTSPTRPASHRATSRPATTPATAPAPARPSAPASPSLSPSTSGREPGPATAQPPTSPGRPPRSTKALAIGGLPRWLELVLVAAGLLIATAFLTEPALAIARRLRAARPAAAVGADDDDAHIVLADYERLVVTHSSQDGTVYVLRPPGADPQTILLAARLVLAQDRYEELAGRLGVPAHWPRE